MAGLSADLAVCPDGLGIIGAGAGVALIAIVDLVAKVVYGLMGVVSMGKLAEEDQRAVPVDRRTRRVAA